MCNFIPLLSRLFFSLSHCCCSKLARQVSLKRIRCMISFWQFHNLMMWLLYIEFCFVFVCSLLLNFANDVTLAAKEKRAGNQNKWGRIRKKQTNKCESENERETHRNGRIKYSLNKIMGDSDDWTISNTYKFDSSCGAYSYKQNAASFFVFVVFFYFVVGACAAASSTVFIYYCIIIIFSSVISFVPFWPFRSFINLEEIWELFFFSLFIL